MASFADMECNYLALHAESNAKKIVMYRDTGYPSSARFVENFIIRDAKRIIKILTKQGEPA